MDWKSIRPWVLPVTPANQQHQPLQLQPGLRHYIRQRNGQYVRYHLRVENSGQALLIVAAVEAARLTRSGAIAAYGVLEGKNDQQINHDLANLTTAPKVIAEVRQMVAELGLPSKRYPVFNLTDPFVEENPQGLIAPFQADVELTNIESLKKYLHALWDAGIPHVRFVSVDTAQPLDEPRLQLLCAAVQYAEDLGMIAGVRMRAGSLANSSLGGKLPVDRIAELGVDYVVLPWGVSEANHELLFGLGDLQSLPKIVERSQHWEFPVVLESGLTTETVQVFEDELDKAIALDIAHIEVFPIARLPKTPSVKAIEQPDNPITPFDFQHMRQLASWIEDLADARRVQLIWLPPHSLVRPDPMAIASLLRNGPRAGSDISIRIDVQGNVYPPRGNKTSVGKIHQTAWSTIWNHTCFRSYRDMVNRNEHCNLCPLLAICAAHCPADEAGWAIEE
jgi:radical SAM protein with 4Fe4S-binding SPASM domain